MSLFAANVVFNAAAESARMGWVMGVMTLFFMTTFLGWAWYAWAPSNREFMEAAARMPLDDGSET